MQMFGETLGTLKKSILREKRNQELTGTRDGNNQSGESSPRADINKIEIEVKIKIKGNPIIITIANRAALAAAVREIGGVDGRDEGK